MYYYFLGKYISGIDVHTSDAIEFLCENSHITANYLTLLFTIHHSRNDDLIDNILGRTANAIQGVPPAALTPDETRRFENVIQALPKEIRN